MTCEFCQDSGEAYDVQTKAMVPCPLCQVAQAEVE